MSATLVPFPANIPMPKPLTEVEARDARRVADWTNAMHLALFHHDNSLRSYLNNLDPVVATTVDNITSIDNSITNISNSITNISTGPISIFGNPVWEWNGADTSQFATTASWTNGANTPLLQVVSSANVNQKATSYLEISSTGTGAGGFGFYITDELPFSTESRDMVLEWVTAPGSTTGYGGFSFLADDSGNAHSYNVFIGPTAGWRSQTDNGTTTLSGTTPASVWAGSGESLGRLWIRGTKPSGAVPRWYGQIEAADGNGFGVTTYSVRIDRRSEWPVEPPGSTWNSVGCKKIGIALQASGLNAYGSFRLTEMRAFLV